MEERKPISSALAFGLIAVGLIVDLVQILLTLLFVGAALNPIIDLMAMGIFWLMLYHHGQKILSRRAMSFIGSAIVELLPFIDAIPVWTFFAIYTVMKDHYEQMQSDMEGDPDNNPGPPTRQTWTRRL